MPRDSVEVLGRVIVTIDRRGELVKRLGAVSKDLLNAASGHGSRAPCSGHPASRALA